MRLDISDMLETPAQVQEKKKYLNFTVKEIGGPLEIIEWRKKQQAKNHLYNTRLGQRDSRLAGFEQETGQKLATPSISSWQFNEKLEFALSERKRLAEQVFEVEKFHYETEAKPNKTILQRFTGFIIKFWNDSGLSN